MSFAGIKSYTKLTMRELTELLIRVGYRPYTTHPSKQVEQEVWATSIENASTFNPRHKFTSKPMPTGFLLSRFAVVVIDSGSGLVIKTIPPALDNENETRYTE